MPMHVAVSDTIGFMVAIATAVLLARMAGRNPRRDAHPSQRWEPALVTATYQQAEAACRALRRERIHCYLIPAAEQFDPALAPDGVIVLVSATRREQARKIVEAAR